MCWLDETDGDPTDMDWDRHITSNVENHSAHSAIIATDQ
jgi:hypothetical protein